MMTNGETVSVEFEKSEAGSVARLILSRPAKLNALSPAMIAALGAAADTVSARDDLRAVVLEGAGGRAFCAGADTPTLGALDPAGARAFITSLHHAIDRVRRLPVPVIAVLRGHCFGAGMELAAACDMRLAETTLNAGMPEVQVGVPSVIEACLLPRLIGWGRTSELLLTGRLIGAEEAAAMRFVERVAAPAGMDAALDEWLSHILRAAPAAVRAQKALMRAWEGDEGPAIAASIDAFEAAYRTGEPARALAPRGK